MDKITTVGLDLAKLIIQVHAIDAAGRVVLRKAVRRERLLALLAQFPRCQVGMEACSGAHHWARELFKLGDELRIMAAEFVRPFRKSLAAKNDANDAEAVCTALRQPNMRTLAARITALDREIAQHAHNDAAAQRLAELTGVGPITTSAIVASVGNASDYRNGRQFAARLGLVPKQFSSGGKTKLGRITKRGDTYLRTLLIHGARSTMQAALRRSPTRRDRISAWIVQLAQRVGYHKALAAIANKHARIIWALLARGESFDRAHPGTH